MPAGDVHDGAQFCTELGHERDAGSIRHAPIAAILEQRAPGHAAFGRGTSMLGTPECGVASTTPSVPLDLVWERNLLSVIRIRLASFMASG
jgi:hypothetical protein